MVSSDRPPANAFVARARRVYNPLGFAKGYNFILWVIFDGAFLGFVLSRFEYLSFNGIFCNPATKVGLGAAPGECYWYETFQRNGVGIRLHLATILPAGLLATMQFMPFIRHNFITFHRICGYLAIILAFISQASVLMIANHAFGGDMSVRTWVGFAVIATTAALGMAYYNVKKLQIDQHRAWMLRAWAWFGCIITIRIITVTASRVAAAWGGEAISYVGMPCIELLSVYGNNATKLYSHYPACMPENIASFTSNGIVAVEANANILDLTNQAASLDTFFGSACWLAFALHVFGMEVYLRLTPRESERLRQVSYERQLERGMKNAGSAGTCVDRFGDADPYVPEHKTSDGSSE